MLEDLKESVFQQNLQLKKEGLIKLTWGNVSGVCREKKLFVIKPSGVSYEEMTAADMVVCDFDGKVIEGSLKPSSDTMTHAVLYREFPEIGGVVHTHSPWATSWAQAGMDVPAMGTTHADTFYGPVPCARYLRKEEIEKEYELNTGKVIIETFKKRALNAMDIPAILLKGHGPFTWGKDPQNAVENSIVLEEVCKLNYQTFQLNSKAEVLPKEVLDKHYLRKHGKNAYYGQE